MPAAAWLVYLYSQNSSTPVNSYQDTALTVLNTWPLLADANGTMPPFWLADGSYRVRGTSADGATTYFDITSVLAIGPSTGSAPSGGVDPTAIFQTGDVMWLDFQGQRAGWVRDNGNTIGSSTSGATELHDATAQPLFLYLWNNFSDTICPVVGGRGANAQNDWNANKKITLPDKRGYVAGGLDDMGAAAAGRWASAPVIQGNVTTAGAQIGENTHTLALAEAPTGQTTITFGTHTHTLPISTTTIAGGSLGVQGVNATNSSIATSGPNPSQLNIAVTDHAGGGAHNVAQRTVLGTFYRKI